MGRWVSSPSSDHLAAGLMLPSVVDTRGRHIMPSDGSRRANLGTRGPAWSAATPGFAASPDPASRQRDLGGSGAFWPPLRSRLFSLRGRADLLAPAEVGSIQPHAMQNGRQLAGQGDLGALQAAALGDIHGPALQTGEANRAAETVRNSV